MISIASNPMLSTRSTIGRIIAVDIRVAHRHWCPSRRVVSTNFTVAIALCPPLRSKWSRLSGSYPAQGISRRGRNTILAHGSPENEGGGARTACIAAPDTQGFAAAHG